MKLDADVVYKYLLCFLFGQKVLKIYKGLSVKASDNLYFFNLRFPN